MILQKFPSEDVEGDKIDCLSESTTNENKEILKVSCLAVCRIIYKVDY